MITEKLELEMQDIRHTLTSLKIEIRCAEKWIENAKETVEQVQNMIFDMEDENGLGR